MTFLKQMKFAGCGVLLGCALISGAAERIWDYRAGSLPGAWNGVVLQLDDAVRTPDGAPALAVTSRYAASELRWPPFVIFPARGEMVIPGAEVTIRFFVKANRPLRIGLRCTENAPASGHYSPTADYKLTTDWQEVVYKEKLYKTKAAPVANLPRMLLYDIGREDRIWLGPLKIEIGSAPAPVAEEKPAPVTVDVTQTGEWAPIAIDDLYIKPGSALDFTAITDRRPAGSLGRLKVDDQGVPYFEKQPGKPVRFFSVQLMANWLPSMEKRDIEEYAAAVARQGYNLVRFHFIDQVLQGTIRGPALKPDSQDSRYRLPEREDEIEFDPAALDRFDYLIAQLRKNGVYINMDAMTTYVGYDGGEHGTPDTRAPYTTKVQMFVNPMFRRNWVAGVSKLFSHVNPYTGLSLKEDPAVVLVSFLNEQEILTEYRDYSVEFKPAWIAFLKRKYGSYESLCKAWNGQCGEYAIPTNGTFDDLPGITYKVASGRSRAGLDMTECIGEMEREMTDFYLDAIRKIGYPGLVTNWNMRTRIVTVPARSKLPAVSMNGYHSHPQNGTNRRGAEVDPVSSVSLAGNSFKHQAVARFVDRPFFNTEFGFCFWNPYRHEQGLVFGAGAALQGWSSITCHAGQVTWSGNLLSPFAAGSDPVIRAAEAVAALAFLRGDVSRSEHLVEIPLDDRFIFGGGRALRGVSDELSRIWMLTRVGISYGPKRARVNPDLVVYPGDTSQLGGTDMFTSVENSVSTSRIAPVVEKLREKGVLKEGNRTDPGRGLYQSDTGELTLSTADGGEMKVVAPRLTGAVVKVDRPVDLGAVRIESCSVPAAVTVASLSKEQAIPEAKRMLLVFSTDALNNGMRFKDERRRVLEKLGTLPVLWRTGKLSLSIRNAAAGSPKLYALALNGERREELPVRVDGGRIQVTVDTAKLKAPTPFFELVLE